MILRGTVYSETLEMDTGITIATPRKLPAAGPYKTAYLLHGIRGNADTWLDRSMLAEHAAQGNKYSRVKRVVLPTPYKGEIPATPKGVHE